MLTRESSLSLDVARLARSGWIKEMLEIFLIKGKRDRPSFLLFFTEDLSLLALPKTPDGGHPSF